MTRVTLLAALLLAGFCAQPAAFAQSSDAAQVIEWSYNRGSDNSTDGPRLHLARRGTRTSLDAQDAPELMSKLARAVSGQVGERVTLLLARQAGSLNCDGAVTEDGSAEGRCSFAPSRDFGAELGRRGLPIGDDDDLLALTLVDAKLVSVDIFARAGLPLADSDDLMTVSALHVTPAFRDELRGAGIEIDSVDDLVSARAVGVDAAWLTAMTEAGYPPRDAEQAIEMRALDITPDYARRMARVLATAEGRSQQ